MKEKALTWAQYHPEVAETFTTFTAWPAEQALMTAERYGLTGCILKPIDVTKFPEQIAAFIVQTDRS